MQSCGDPPKTLLFCSVPYSYYFSDLASSFLSMDVGEFSVLFLLETPAQLIYLKPSFWTRARFSIEGVCKSLNGVTPHACLCYSDSRWSVRVAENIFRRRSKFFYFERGIYRGRTISFSQNGVNSRALPTISETFEEGKSFEFPTNNDERPLSNRNKVGLIGEARKNSFFLLFMLLYKIFYLLNFNNYHKKISFKDYFIKFIRNSHLKKNKKLLIDWKSQRLVIGIAGQVLGDTNLQQSDNAYNDSQQLLVDVIEKKVGSVVFRPHPLDSQPLVDESNEDILISNGESLDEFLDNIDLLVTVNSTVGFEALKKEVPVVYYGRSFWTRNMPFCMFDGLEHQLEDIVRYLSDPSVVSEWSEVHRWTRHVETKYQKEGDIFNYTPGNLRKIVLNVLNQE